MMMLPARPPASRDTHHHGCTMASDSPYQPHPRPLSSETMIALREAVLRHLERGADGDDELGRAVAFVVAEARRESMRAEELILAFKSLYDALPEPKSAVARAEQVQLRERLVTACIRAYYQRED
jgi:hypothetical protein